MNKGKNCALREIPTSTQQGGRWGGKDLELCRNYPGLSQIIAAFQGNEWVTDTDIQSCFFPFKQESEGGLETLHTPKELKVSSGAWHN